MLSLRTFLPAAAAVVAFSGATAAHASPTILSPAAPAPTIVAAYAGTVMWSSLDKTTGSYALMKSVGGAPGVAVGVAERDKPFDIDLGTNRGTEIFAVYTRHGFIYRLRVSTGVEQKLTKLSMGGQDRDPSIQRGQIAFLHSGRGHAELRIGNSTASGQYGGGKPRLIVTGTIDDVELGISQVAYTVFKDGEFGGSQTVHIRNIRSGHDLAVYRAASGGVNTASITKPSFTEDSKAFVWARTNMGEAAGNRIVKYTLHTGKLSYAIGSKRNATTAWAGGALGAAYSTAEIPRTNEGCRDAGVDYCTVGTTGPLTFDARP
jgi:hypothetical protein